MPSAVLTRAFAAPSRDRGEDLARSGAVYLQQVSAQGAIAHVLGGQLYLTSVHVQGRDVVLGCSCPHAAGGACCKHLWATLLRLESAAAARALVQALHQARVVRLEALAGENGDPRRDDDREMEDERGPFEEHTAGPWSGSRVALAETRPAAPASWQAVLDHLARQMHAAEVAERRIDIDPTWSDDRRLVFVLDAGSAPGRGAVVLEVQVEKRHRDGSWGPPRRLTLSTHEWLRLPDLRDRAIARLLLGAAPPPDHGYARTIFALPAHALPHVLPVVCASGRARVRLPGPPPTLLPVRWDEHAGSPDTTLVPWRVALAVARDAASPEAWVLRGELVRDDARRPLSDATWLHGDGLCLLDDLLAPLALDGQWPLVSELMQHGPLAVGSDPGPALERVHRLPRVPDLLLPPDYAVSHAHTAPVPGVRFVPDPLPWRRAGASVLGVQLAFRYGALVVDATETGTMRFDASTRTLHHRDRDAERDARDRLRTLGVSSARETGVPDVPFVLPRTQLPRVARQLASEGWWVEAEGREFRMPGAVQARVRSGVDWFDLEGSVRYGDTSVSLADVLDARRRGLDVVTLADGSVGVLPEAWLDRLGPVLAGGEPTAEGARFRSSQLALLDALLATLPDVDVDAEFARAREALQGFERVTPAEPPASFAGTLRPYQREGLGWLHFLRTFGFGGCLADDMGLGKTIQVLALLETRRLEGHGPSLVVVPRSLVYNWRAEAARFTPALRVADWSGADRLDAADGSARFDTRDVDVALVTYGTLRRDAAALADIAFDYVVLDEAQAIKNRTTATAKACRVLQAAHRLALSGTPIENRVDELWSLLDFLNPGMLGTSSRFSASLRAVSDERVVDEVLSRALRPVILRRTKAQVAPELPARIERTLEVELEPRQRAFYDQVHKAVRAEVLQHVESKGLGRARLHILEGLLRLRQAACHPVLADPRKRALPSAKLDALVPALADVAAEGHKALVFSQFTSFLALVRAALDAEGIAYEYLDGRTKDRQARVERFQQDASCPVFLISLKAGGHGLNLTAADYVYLLDPWWNPAVEAQAIDRAHRIGRTRHVIATRVVAKGTIEEKILALQASKRALADAILSADRGGLASIGREELELLLG